MADGTRSVALEAEAAAAEAAREAKAEVLERAGKVEGAGSAAARGQSPKVRQEVRLGRVHRRCLDHQLQLGRVRHLQAQPQPRQVAPVHLRHGYLRRGRRERRAHRPPRLSRGPLAQERRHGQASRLQALQRDGELARHHGPDDRPQPAADARRARAAGHLLLGQRRRPRQHDLRRALGQQVAARCRSISRSSCSTTASRSSTG